MENLNNTQYFTVQKEPELQVRDVLEITSHNNARSLIMKVERDELVEEVLRAYIKNNSWE